MLENMTHGIFYGCSILPQGSLHLVIRFIIHKKRMVKNQRIRIII